MDLLVANISLIALELVEHGDLGEASVLL